MTMLTNKDFPESFQLYLLFNPLQNDLYIFGWLPVKILFELHVKKCL